MTPGRRQGFIHPSAQGRGRAHFHGAADARLFYPIALALGTSLILTGSVAELTPWFVSAGVGLMILAAWLLWRQRAPLRQQWRAVYEELHKLY